MSKLPFSLQNVSKLPLLKYKCLNVSKYKCERFPDVKTTYAKMKKKKILVIYVYECQNHDTNTIWIYPVMIIFFTAFCLPNKTQIILWLPETNKCKTLLNKCPGNHRTDVCLLSKATCNYCWRSDPQCNVSDVGQTHSAMCQTLVRPTVLCVRRWSDSQYEQ